MWQHTCGVYVWRSGWRCKLDSCTVKQLHLKKHYFGVCDKNVACLMWDRDQLCKKCLHLRWVPCLNARVLLGLFGATPVITTITTTIIVSDIVIVITVFWLLALSCSYRARYGDVPPQQHHYQQNALPSRYPLQILHSLCQPVCQSLVCQL